MIRLYPFQSRGLDEGRAAYRRGRRAVLFVGPTGMGKTTLASAAAMGVIERGGRVVAIAHRRELVVQMAQRLEAMGLSVGYLGLRPKAPVQVRSVQAILAAGEMPDATFAIVDEAHHYVSDEWIRPVRAYLDAGARIMGLSATPARDDGRGLGISEGGIFDELVTVAQVSDLVALNAIESDKGITPIDTWGPSAHVRALALDPYAAYLERCPGRSAVVFAPNVKTAEKFAEDFRRARIPAGIVHGELDTLDRDGSLSRFARGELKVIVNVNVLTEGWDAPICDVCILARKVGSLSLLIQMIGRARRPHHPGKVALLLDLSGNLDTHDFHPDDLIEYSLDGQAIRVGKGTGFRSRICRVCRRVLDEDIARAKDAGVELLRCPECNTDLSKIRVPTAEEIELARIERDEARARTPLDKRAKALITLYAKGLRASHKKPQAAAHHAYRNMFRHFPPNEVRIPAWKAAVELVAKEKGDAWEQPPIEETGS